MTFTAHERQELEDLRRFKEAHEGKAMTRAFNRLESLLETPGFDPLVSIRAFRVLSECLLALRDRVDDSQRD